MLKADFEGGHQAGPVLPAHYIFADILFTNPQNANRRYVLSLKALPFGAVASVCSWERLDAALASILQCIDIQALRDVDHIFLLPPRHSENLARAW